MIEQTKVYANSRSRRMQPFVAAVEIGIQDLPCGNLDICNANSMHERLILLSEPAMTSGGGLTRQLRVVTPPRLVCHDQRHWVGALSGDGAPRHQFEAAQ